MFSRAAVVLMKNKICSFFSPYAIFTPSYLLWYFFSACSSWCGISGWNSSVNCRAPNGCEVSVGQGFDGYSNTFNVVFVPFQTLPNVRRIIRNEEKVDIMPYFTYIFVNFILQVIRQTCRESFERMCWTNAIFVYIAECTIIL